MGLWDCTLGAVAVHTVIPKDCGCPTLVWLPATSVTACRAGRLAATRQDVRSVGSLDVMQGRPYCDFRRGRRLLLHLTAQYRRHRPNPRRIRIKNGGRNGPPSSGRKRPRKQTMRPRAGLLREAGYGLWSSVCRRISAVQQTEMLDAAAVALTPTQWSASLRRPGTRPSAGAELHRAPACWPPPTGPTPKGAAAMVIGGRHKR